MLTKVAVLSDIHAVLPAMEAVLAEPDVAAADLIVLTGDIAALSISLLLDPGESRERDLPEHGKWPLRGLPVATLDQS